jgi:hypothetical protein
VAFVKLLRDITLFHYPGQNVEHSPGQDVRALVRAEHSSAITLLTSLLRIALKMAVRSATNSWKAPVWIELFS